MSANPGTTLPVDPQLLEDVSKIAHRQPGCNLAFERIRKRAGVTQDDLARRFHRRATAVCNWESGKSWPPTSLLPRILECLSVPTEVVTQFFSVELDGDLDPRLYARGDAVTIEYQWFKRTRGQVLQSVYIRARDGSSADAKLYKDWMEQIERQHAARESKPRAVLETSVAETRESWTGKALKSAKKAALTAQSVADTSAVDIQQKVAQNEKSGLHNT